MLIRISLIVAILAGLAVGGLNFVKVKEKITTLQTNLKEQTEAPGNPRTELASTKKDLDKTTAELKQTKADAGSHHGGQGEGGGGPGRSNQARRQVDRGFEQDPPGTGRRPGGFGGLQSDGRHAPADPGMNKEFKTLQDNLAVADTENKILTQKIKKLETELAVYRDPNFFVSLPAGLKGKVLVADPKWNFVVLNVGEDQGVLERGELLVNRNGKLVAKVVVRSVQKDRCIANVLPGWELGEVMEGDQVIPAHPAS